MIRNKDGVNYSYDSDFCNGSGATILVIPSCSVLISDLVKAPFNLAWGSSVYAVVQAYNAYGDSDFSDAGNGAIIYTAPDAPISLSENIAFRTSSQLQINWLPGVSNGGSAIISYRVSFDQGTGVWAVINSTVHSTNLTVTGLTFG